MDSEFETPSVETTYQNRKGVRPRDELGIGWDSNSQPFRCGHMATASFQRPCCVPLRTPEILVLYILSSFSLKESNTISR